jgi:N-acetyl-anhydromuramyl-L-alanine amidase AmpD
MFWQKILKADPSAEAHYVIGRTGIKAQVMPLTQIANHTVGINPISIGIELVHRGDGKEPFEEPQILTLIETIKEVRRHYPKISLANIVEHSDIDERTCSCGGKVYRRRQDPGANFPMQRVINEVRLPNDVEVGASTLPHLEGPAPKEACAVYQR